MKNLSVQEALKLILDNVEPTQSELISITLATQRILAEDHVSKLTNPPFDTSAMDGYAVKLEDIEHLPARLRIIGEARAGSSFTEILRKGQCVRIFTGAPLPSGAEYVIVQENTERLENFIEIKINKISTSNIRKRGSDFKQGDVLLKKGLKLDSRAIMLAAAMGYSELSVHKKPRIAILSTGDELVEPGVIPNSNQIIASNSYGLLSLAETSGAHGYLLGIAKDSKEELIAKFSEAKEADIIVTTGGVSVGDYDMVGPALLSLGMEIKFWNISMKPGKPMLYGRIGKKIILGLPGNPISAFLTALIFLVPLIEKLLNFQNKKNDNIRGKLSSALEQNGPRKHYMRAEISRNSTGDFLVKPQTSQDSSLVSQFAKANALIIREAHAPHVDPDAEIEVVPLNI